MCGKEVQLQRTYWHYAIKCECHSPSHFEMKCHCADCIPVEPITTKITIKDVIDGKRYSFTMNTADLCLRADGFFDPNILRFKL